MDFLTNPSRPAGVTLLSLWYIITGGLSFFWNLLTTVFGAVIGCFAPQVLGQGVWGLITGLLNLVLGFSLLSGRNWSQLVVTVLAILGIVTNILRFTDEDRPIGAILSIVVNGLVLLYLQTPAVKRYFAAR
jgi:uncharacterized membrane protein (UPF0136 family)